MDLEHGSKDSKLPGIVIDESGEGKQSKTLAKDPDGSEESKQSKTPVNVLDGSEKSKQWETPVKVLDGSREIKQSLMKVLDGSGESEQSETPRIVPDESGESKQLKTPPIVTYVSGESKQSPKVHNGNVETNKSESTMKALDEIQESKQSEAPSKVPAESGENKELETFPKDNDGRSSPTLQSTVVEANAEGAHRRATSETLPEVKDGSGGINHSSSPPLPSKVVDVPAKGGHRRAPSRTPPKVNDGSGGSKHSFSPSLPSKVVEAATTKGDHIRTSSDRLLSFTSTSSSGSNISMDDLFQVDSSRFSTSSHIPPLPKDYGQNSPYRESAPRRSNVSNELPTESPGIQMMDRYGGYDPYRIPSSVFDTNNLSSKEMDWSVASNESLFSLHLGNNSFSREHLLMLGDLGPTKSGELLGISTPRTPHTPPPIIGTEINKIEEGRESAAEELADENIKDNIGYASAERYNEGRPVPLPTVSSSKSPSLAPSLAPSHRSDGSGFSGASTRSFAFPILTDGTKNSLKLAQESEEQHPELLPPARATKKSSKKRCRWLPCFSWCCKWSCGCSWFSCCRRFCSCRFFSCRFCSCPRCFHRACCCF